MPVFAAELGLSVTEFGLVGSAVGATRLLSNLPLAVASERFGRKPFLTIGPAITSVAMIGTGFSGSLGALLGWRALTGIGGSAQMMGAQLYLTDISKPWNRARTLAPTSAAFSAGASVGPAIGGVLAQNFGVAPCFFYVGGAIGVVGLMNYFLLPETRIPKSRVLGRIDPASGEDKNGTFTGFVRESRELVGQTVGTWRRLGADRNVGIVCTTHLAYWCTISGAQFTLMPIFASQEVL